MIHDDGVKGAVLGAKTAVHAKIAVNVEVGWAAQGSAGFGVCAAFDPDTLRRTNASAGAAGGTALDLFALLIQIKNQKGQETKGFRHVQLALRDIPR